MTTGASMAFLRRLIHAQAAIVIDDDKDYLVESRLHPVAERAGLPDLDALVSQLRRGPSSDLLTQVVEALTTNETYFFRDLHPFETLRTHILPQLACARGHDRTLRVWCAASSTGQEPYSIAMTIFDALPDAAQWSIDIIGTDINGAVIERARSGTYKQHEVNRGLPVPTLVKYFEQDGLDWKVRPEIRRCVRFQCLNLLDPWPWSERFDMIFMRNVLIYFDAATKSSLLSRLRNHLASDGVLFLGGTETTLSLGASFSHCREDRTVYFKVRGS